MEAESRNQGCSEEILKDMESDLARFYEIAYLFSQNWVQIAVRLRQMIQLAQFAREVYYERRYKEPHPDNSVEASIEICTFFSFFAEKVQKLQELIGTLLEQLTLESEDYQFILDKIPPPGVYRTQYPLMLIRAVQEDLYDNQIYHLPHRLLLLTFSNNRVDIEELLRHRNSDHQDGEEKDG